MTLEQVIGGLNSLPISNKPNNFTFTFFKSKVDTCHFMIGDKLIKINKIYIFTFLSVDVT